MDLGNYCSLYDVLMEVKIRRGETEVFDVKKEAELNL
jgi:hypothetical protein